MRKIPTMNNEHNEQLHKETDVLKADNTQLRINDDAIKDENKQLATLLDKMAVNNENQMQQINLLCNEVQQLKVSVIGQGLLHT